MTEQNHLSKETQTNICMSRCIIFYQYLELTEQHQKTVTVMNEIHKHSKEKK